MKDEKLIEKIKQWKDEQGYTLHELSKKLDIHISTIERWFKTNRINKVYAELVRGKLELK